MEQKNLKKYPEYSIGLDIGTNSVGWAVTDSENNILKHGGKNMWGARLFDEGDTAAQTRTFRGTRRRIERRRERVNILQSLLLDDMEREYPNVFPIPRPPQLIKISQSVFDNSFLGEYLALPFTKTISLIVFFVFFIFSYFVRMW